MCVTTRNIFLIPNDAVARNLIIVYNVYNFSCQRPHLNYLFFSNVYSFDTSEFFMKRKGRTIRKRKGGGGGGEVQKNIRTREN